jgi:DNA invertase Pin-like site-specific DNA recombinase
MQEALLYLRVSSKGQEDNYSLDAQEKLGIDYACKNNLEIVKIWKGAESAWGKKER